MKVNYPPTAIPNMVAELHSKLDYATELSNAAGAKEELLELYSIVRAEVDRLLTHVQTNDLSTDYVNDLARDLDRLVGTFPRDYGTPPGERKAIALSDKDKQIFKMQQERDEPFIREKLAAFRLTFDFFCKVDFLNSDMVIVGANGSGKTFLAGVLQKHTKEKGVIISAQRILHLPKFEDIKTVEKTYSDLRTYQKGGSKTLEYELLARQFETLIKHMLAEDAFIQKEYKKKAFENSSKGLPIDPPELSNLEFTIRIWNSLYQSPKLINEDGMNLMAISNEDVYPVTEMSDGEKVSLFLIAQILKIPDQGFAIVDEPELYLHPAVVSKLWETMEDYRPDLVFIYITHDLEFAAAKGTNAKKLWLRGFKYPETFLLEEIPSMDLPKALLLELLGTRKNVLFCEGSGGGLDEKLYSIMYPNYIIKPVGGCNNVINYTKAFNRIPNLTWSAIGIIDADYQPEERIMKLKPQHIYGISMPEIENMLFDEPLLHSVCRALELSEQKVEVVKESVLQLLKRDRDFQVSNFVTAKVDHYLKDHHVARAAELTTLKENLGVFFAAIDIDGWASQRGKFIDDIIKTQNYSQAIRVINNKGLVQIAHNIFEVKDYKNLAIEALKNDRAVHAELKKRFPVEGVLQPRGGN